MHRYTDIAVNDGFSLSGGWKVRKQPPPTQSRRRRAHAGRIGLRGSLEQSEGSAETVTYISSRTARRSPRGTLCTYNKGKRIIVLRDGAWYGWDGMGWDGMG
ncbi:uncharacterized protein B0H18DRAFT_972364 [Fomitopsis serialis]|uniref:uncharacterized protein n=1 Tax=Fomitopsis serialis TaxID=139415 RepID=UPI002008E8C5